MKILKIKSKRPPHRLVGVSVENYLHEYMTLYCLAKGITKARIIKGFLNEWMKEQRMVETDDTLIHEIINRIGDRYTEDPKFKDFPFEDFKILMEQELTRNGLKPSYITMVMSKL